MKSRNVLTRREFLWFGGIAGAGGLLAACGGSIPDESPTNTMLVPTGTPEPTIPLPSETPAPFIPEMVRVEPGTFMMGSEDGLAYEAPIHEVTITRPYLVAIYAATNAEYAILCDRTKKCTSPSDNLPVSGVDWYEAVAYCNWLSEQAGLMTCYSGKGKFTKCDFLASGYRLPTEAEWEYAARGGNMSEGFIFAGGDEPDPVAWYADNSNGEIHPVGEKMPNELGIYDMSGNRWEWCWDWFEEDYYASSPDVDPLGPSEVPSGMMIEKSRRSGSSIEEAHAIRTTYRSADGIDYPGGNGFRLVRTAT